MKMKINKDKVHVFMARKEMTLKDLANEYGCTVQYINATLTRGTARPATIGKIARILGCDVTEIIDL